VAKRWANASNGSALGMMTLKKRGDTRVLHMDIFSLLDPLQTISMTKSMPAQLPITQIIKQKDGWEFTHPSGIYVGEGANLQPSFRVGNVWL